MQEFSSFQFGYHLVMLCFHHVFDSFSGICFTEEMAVSNPPGQKDLTIMVDKGFYSRIILSFILCLDMEHLVTVFNVSIESYYHKQIII